MMVGRMSLTVSVRVVLPAPPALTAVMVYVVPGLSAVGVPLICPVTVLKLRPVGRAGAMVQLSAAPPRLVGVIRSIAVPLVNT